MKVEATYEAEPNTSRNCLQRASKYEEVGCICDIHKINISFERLSISEIFTNLVNVKV